MKMSLSFITNPSGTHAYCDPAYISTTGILTKESDVYSFGVVLFEVLCGRLAFINVNSEERFLAPLAQSYYKEGRLDEIMDPYLKTEVDSDSLNTFSVIAYQCLLNDRKQRPSMDLVVQKLEELTVEAKRPRGPHENLEGYKNENINISNGVLKDTNSLIPRTISDLAHEFKQLLSLYSQPVEPDRLYECLPSSLRPSSHTDHVSKGNAFYKPLILISPWVLPLLHDLAQHMVNAGYSQQCLIIYRDMRSQALQKSLHQLGVEKLSKDDVEKLQWRVLQIKVRNWINFMRIAVKLLFAAERKVCDQMFEGTGSLKHQCFGGATKDGVAMLLSFGDATAERKKSSEELFVLLEMCDIMCELHSEFETLFSGSACKEIREAALGLTTRLAQTAKDTIGHLEEAFENTATRTSPADGSVTTRKSPFSVLISDLFSD